MRAANRPSGVQPGPSISVAMVVIGLGAVALIAVMIAAMLAAASGIDAAARVREERLVANGLRLHAETVRRSLTPSDVWDEAVKHLDLKFDPAWARSFVGEDLWHTNGYQRIFVVDAIGRPEFAYEFGHNAAPGDFVAFAKATAPLIANVRVREATRAPFRPGDSTQPNAIDVSSFARVGPQIYLLTASLVQPDRTAGALPNARAPVLVIAEAVDREFLSSMRRRYLVGRLQLVPTVGSAKGYATADLSTMDGAMIGHLAWRPSSPISELFDNIGPAFALAFLVLGSAAGLLIWHERRRHRDLWRAMREARQASDAKSAFLATISHEIRTPLNGVLGMVQAMEGESLAPIQQERLAIIRESGSALLEILSDALDISKIESGKLILEYVDFDLEALIRSARAAFTGLAESKGLVLEARVAPAAGGLWRGDPMRTRQVVHNLISNAIKFTENGSVTLNVATTETGVIIAVADTGVGIDPDKIPGLFEKFVQADSSTTRQYGGAGLGLAICRELCAAMGGSITACSELGAGSTFTVDLPLIRAEKAPVHEIETAIGSDSSPQAAERPLRVLAAEDNAVNRIVLQTLLAQIGIDPTIVTNGAEAVQAFPQAAWDLVLMDVQMPVMDGLQAAREIRAIEAANGPGRTRIVALTANAMAHQTAEYLAAGMDDSLAKPIEIARLYEVINGGAIAKRDAA